MVTLGVQIEPQFGYDYREILEIGEGCGSLGFSTLTVSDHFMLRGDWVGVPSLECWSVVAALARDVRRVRMGSLVSCTA